MFLVILMDMDGDTGLSQKMGGVVLASIATPRQGGGQQEEKIPGREELWRLYFENGVMDNFDALWGGRSDDLSLPARQDTNTASKIEQTAKCLGFRTD